MTVLLREFKTAYDDLYQRAGDVIRDCPDEMLFTRPRTLSNSLAPFSIGEFVVRAVGKTEQTFGGITTRLWDDPFEWTLPESFVERTAISTYLDEAAATVEKGFAYLGDDSALLLQIPAPVKMLTIGRILIDTIVDSSTLLGKGEALFQLQTGRSRIGGGR